MINLYLNLLLTIEIKTVKFYYRGIFTHKYMNFGTAQEIGTCIVMEHSHRTLLMEVIPTFLYLFY